MRIFAFAAAFFLFAACGSEADETAPGGPGGWRVDKSASRLSFTATQTGKPFTGEFGDFNAVIDFDPDNLADAKISVIVKTGSARTGDRQRDDALPTGDWFAAAAFPEAAFVAGEVAAVGAGRYEARGDLTIRGESRPLILPFTVSIEGNRAVADGETSLIRTDFGVGQGEFASDEWVGFEVLVAFHIEATRSGE
ncbi:MAG: YceI family protein [Parvularculaceae bacterium]|nr:YceI family protein [Parvularculaceae bacterium]